MRAKFRTPGGKSFRRARGEGGQNEWFQTGVGSISTNTPSPELAQPEPQDK